MGKEPLRRKKEQAGQELSGSIESSPEMDHRAAVIIPDHTEWLVA